MAGHFHLVDSIRERLTARRLQSTSGRMNRLLKTLQLLRVRLVGTASHCERGLLVLAGSIWCSPALFSINVLRRELRHFSVVRRPSLRSKWRELPNSLER